MKEINAFYNVERAQLPVGSLYGSDIENLNSLQAGAGTKVMRADDSGLWLGAETFADAPFSVDMEGNVIMASATITGFLEDGEAAADVNANATTIDGGKITALSITASQIAASTITGAKIAANTIAAANIVAGTITATEIASNAISASKIQSDAITASKIQAGAVEVDHLDSTIVSAGKIITSLLTASNIQTGTLNASLVAVTNLSASNITTGTLSVGNTSQPSSIVIRRNGQNGYLTWEGGNKIWSDNSEYMGFTADGERFYFYTGATLYALFQRGSQATFYSGVDTGGNLNVSSGNARVNSGKMYVNTTSSPSETLYVEGSAKFVGNTAANHMDPRSSNSYNLGGSSNYWAYLNCHDVSYHSLGFYDEGVTVIIDGKETKVSDVEAIKMMKPHPTLKTKDGAPLMDKMSMPKEMFIAAHRRDGTPYDRDPETGYPIIDDDEVYFDKNGNEKRRAKTEIKPDADGQSGAQLLALALGAVRELDGKIEALQDELAEVKSSVANRPLK